MNFEMDLVMCDNEFGMSMNQTTSLKGKDGENGKDGLSAYQIAQQQGFEGTEQEWLDSLKGETYDDTELSSRVTELENTIGTLNDSLEEVLNGNGN